MKDLLFGTSKTAFSVSAKLAFAVIAALGAAGLVSACSSDSTLSSSGDGSSAGSSSGSHSGSASGSASGSSGSASGSTSGVSTGDAGANDSATGDDGGDGAAPYVPETCTAACMTATGCPTAQCYAASANPVASPTTANVPETLLYPKYAHDGLLSTRYSTGAPAVGMEWFQIDLCRTASVNGVTLDDSTSMLDQAAAYTVQVSLDGATWTQVAMGSSIPATDSGAVLDASTIDASAMDASTMDAMDSAVAVTDSSAADGDSSAAPVEASVPPPTAPAVLTIPFAPVMARYVRVNQTGVLPTSARTGMSHWWSIDEIGISCAGSGGGDAAAASDSSSDVAIDAAGQ